jgi:hypothetical protein
MWVAVPKPTSRKDRSYQVPPFPASSQRLRDSHSRLLSELLRYDEGLLVVKINAFHVQAHAGVCRWLMNIRGTEGAGTDDGENDERLWSILKPLAGPASRMTDPNYTDMLAHAIQTLNDRSVGNPVSESANHQIRTSILWRTCLLHLTRASLAQSGGTNDYCREPDVFESALPVRGVTQGG